MKNLNETIQRVKDYEPLWDGWKYTGTLIGSGGSGCVLELERGEERSVVKVIYVDDNIERYNAVKNEIETMITLRNNYLVECLDYREEEVFNRRGDKVGYDFLIRMNKYDPFAEYLREEDFDANAICVQLTLEIGIALCVLHSHGILHRDVKPENIFIDRSGKKPHFRLGDFGVSKRISDMSGLTATGTLKFMAPESYQYNEYSYRSDIYNFGMTLYYILNDLCFPKYVDEKSQSDIDANIELRLSGERIPAPKYGSALLKKVVLKCCEFKPKDRYADVSELLSELFGQNIMQVRVKLKKEETEAHKKSQRRKILFFSVIVFGIAVVATIAVLLTNSLFQNQHLENDGNNVLTTSQESVPDTTLTVPKYSTAFIDDKCIKIDNDKERLIKSSENPAYSSLEDYYVYQFDKNVCITKSFDEVIDWNNLIHYSQYCFDENKKVFYIRRQQLGITYHLYIYNNEIIKMKCEEAVYGTKTYYYGDPKITEEIKNIVNEAYELYPKAMETLDNNPNN